MSLLDVARRLRRACDDLDAGAPYVYNPLDYAWDAHAQYVERYGRGRPRAILVGMNPGPHGMGQTGVPFGDVAIVRDWMGIERRVAQPRRVHPKRPVQGFASRRREPSGSRLYGWAQQRFGEAERFFGEFFVLNYCPLLFFDEEGRNLTPPQLRKADTEALYTACDEHLAQATRVLRPQWLLGVGGFAQKRVQEVVDREGLDVKVGGILHPSPASPLANKGWAAQAEGELRRLGVLA